MEKPNIFLRLKAWQLFVIFLIPNFVAFNYYLECIFGALFIITYIGWVYSIGLTMHLRLAGPKPSTQYFKISCLLIFCSYIATFCTYTAINFVGSYTPYSVSEWGLLPLVLYLIWTFLYVFMFSARMLESVCEGYLVYRSDSLKAFFGFWFFPIGVWFIQPVVHRILSQDVFIEV